MWKWISNLFQKKLVIEERRILMPKEGEIVLFNFPKDTPREIMQILDKRLVEADNLGYSYIIMSGVDLEVMKTKKKQIRRGKHGDDKIGRHKESARKG